MKYCVQCRFHQKSETTDDGEFDRCKQPEVSPVSLVTGVQKLAYCEHSRSKGTKCGPDAAMFEPLQ